MNRWLWGKKGVPASKMWQRISKKEILQETSEINLSGPKVMIFKQKTKEINNWISEQLAISRMHNNENGCTR